MDGLELLAAGNYIAVNRSLIKTFGLECAVLIGELSSESLYWKEHGQLEEGWFFSTIENVEESTGLSGYQQRKALSSLCELGIIETAQRGLPKKRYIRINFDALMKTLDDKSLKNFTTGSEETEHLELEKVDINNNKEKQKQITTMKRFIPPTPYEVSAYMKSVGESIDAESFCDYWESVGWIRGRTKMKNWKAAARQWAKNDRKWGKQDAEIDEYTERLDF